jgi:hypothetical protein
MELTRRRKRKTLMDKIIKRVRARARGRNLELLEDVELPTDREFTVGIEVPVEKRTPIVEALAHSAGAWSDEQHPELETRENVVQFVKTLRTGYERGL